jgi:MTH538 TIR-like domain (DUF1863)
MRKTIFISYYFNDATFKGEVKAWLSRYGHEVISVDKEDLRQDGKNVVRASIRADIDRSDVILVLVGNSSHNRPWIDYEIDVAQSKEIPIYWVRLPNRTGAPPLEVRNIEGIDFNETAIRYVVNNLR